MMGHTHAVFGIATLAVIHAGTQPVGGLIQPHPVNGVPIGPTLCLGAAVLGALLPDLDARQSAIQHELGLVGRAAHSSLSWLGVKHRGVLHSGLVTLLVLLGAALLGWRSGYLDAGLAVGIGYISHVVIADAMTISGVPLFWPLGRRFHLLPRPLRVRTGGPVEWVLFGLVTALFLWLLPALVPVNFIALLLNSIGV